jgi:hypothetical protein
MSLRLWIRLDYLWALLSIYPLALGQPWHFLWGEDAVRALILQIFANEDAFKFV